MDGRSAQETITDSDRHFQGYRGRYFFWGGSLVGYGSKRRQSMSREIRIFCLVEGGSGALIRSDKITKHNVTP